MYIRTEFTKNVNYYVFKLRSTMKKLILAFAAFLTASTSTFAQLGSADKDLVYTPVTPCRVLDTRTSQGGTGAIAADGTKHFKIWGQNSYSAQGGKNSDCGITAGSNVAAVAMNFTVVTPAAGGFITAYPFGGVLPVAATVNFQVGDIARGDFTIAKVAQTGTAATDHLSIFSTSLADVVGDVVGYYSRPLSAGSLECTDGLIASATVGPGLIASATAPACAASHTATATNCSTSSGVIVLYYSGWGSCSARNTTTGTLTGTVYSGYRCCKIPGR
jgi:hypothetical protein